MSKMDWFEGKFVAGAPTTSPARQGAEQHRERVYRILAGEIAPEYPSSEFSLLKAHAAASTPYLHPPEQVIIRGVIFGFIGIGVVFLTQLFKLGLPLQVIGFTLSGVVILEAVRRGLAMQRAVRRTARQLHECLAELNDVAAILERYLEQVDKRTAQYFHIMTNTKLTTFCVLRQIQIALDERTREIASLLTWPTSESVLVASDLLKKLLLFRDGFVRETGQIFTLPPSDLKAKVLLLIDDLEIGLAALEETIQLPTPPTGRR